LPDQEFSPGTNIGNRMFGTDRTGTVPREQMWPEKMIRSGLTLAGDVLSGKVPDLVGMRREDFTDEPPPQGPTQDSTWLGRKLGLAPVAVQPGDEMIERAQDMSGLAGGGSLLVGPAEKAVLRSGPMRNIDRTQTGWTFKDVAYPHDRMERGDWRKVTRATETGEGIQEVELPIRAMNATQKAVNPDFADTLGSGKNDPPFVIKKDGQYFVQDGRQRLVAAAGAGNQTAKVRLVDLDPPTTDPAQMRLLSDTSQPGAAVSALGNAGKAPVFYSALSKAVDVAPHGAIPAEQWAGWVNNQKGLKKEEIQWTGLDKWLEGQKGKKVTKEDVQAYLDEHRVEIKDVTKSDTSAKHAKWQLPGGGNYREHLLTLPERRPYTGASFQDWVKRIYGKDVDSYPSDKQGWLRVLGAVVEQPRRQLLDLATQTRGNFIRDREVGRQEH